MKYKYIFFDLDGTISDSGPGIIKSAAYALEKFGIIETDEKKLGRFVGPALIDSFQEFYGLTEEQARQGVIYYRERYKPIGLYENTVYPGIEELLKRLKADGYMIVVATSKPEVMAVDVLKYFKLADYFDLIAGATLDETRLKKSQVLEYAIEKCGITDTSEILMVGDRNFDVLGAAAFDIKCLGVLYGYGSEEELLTAGAVSLANTPEEIYQYIKNCE